MDPLSATASVIAILQLTSKVLGYLNDVKGAPKECQQCAIEASNLQHLLISLRYRLEQGQTGDPWFTAVRTLSVENGPLDQYRQALEELQSKLEVGNSVREIKRQLAWKFTKAEVAGILARMERLKSLVSIALEMDHFKLSQATKDHVDSVRAALPVIQASLVTVEDAQCQQQHHTVMEWLSPTDFPAQQHDIISRRQEGTGQWFLNSAEFEKWLQGSDKTLFCPGIPGAGKTMVAAIAVDHLCRTTQFDSIGLAYLFCNYKVQADQLARNLLAALLKQLVQSRPDIAAPVRQIYEQHSKRGSRPSLHDVFTALGDVCSNYTTVYIVVDALDECADNDGARSELIDRLHELQARMDVRLLFTSRFNPDITRIFQSYPVLEVRASEEDVRRFVMGQIPRLPNCIRRDDRLKRAIQDRIVETVDGMFLLARLHVDSFLDKRNKQKVLSTLERLSKGSENIDEAYNEAIQRIDGQLPEDRLLARRALSWISCAQRQLTTKELCHALAIEPGDSSLNSDNIYDVEDVVCVCAGLVTVDEESNIIRLVHYTTQEYFERVLLEWNPNAQEEIAVACLTYLCFDTFRTGSCDGYEEFEQRLEDNVLFRYSARYWSEHIRPVEKSTSSLALAFLCDEALVNFAVQVAGISNYKKRSGLHLTARYGLLYLTERLLMHQNDNNNIRADSKDRYGQTPLSKAARAGHKTVVRLLVERDDVEADSRDNCGQTPLSNAAENGHETVVRLLVERDDVEADSRDNWGQTPLSNAAENGHETVVRLLVERDDVEADSRDNWGQTPLSNAAENGHETVVRLLVERDDVEADSRDNWGQTPLSHAAKQGHETVVKVLLAKEGINIDSKDDLGNTPLFRAALNGHEVVVKLLLATGSVDLNIPDQYGRTPLWWAARNGHEAVVKLLLATDSVNPNSRDRRGQTPLLEAARNGHEGVVKLLLETGKINPNSKDDQGWTPLSVAAIWSHQAVVDLLSSSS